MKLNPTSMFYGTLLLTLTSLVSQLLGFVYRIFLSRLVGAEVLGLYQLIMPVYSVLMSITAVGLTVAASNLSARYHALGNHRAVHQTLKRCLAAFFLLFSLPALAVLLFSDPISVYLLGDARTQLGLILLLPCILLTGVENLHKHYFYGTGNIRPPAAVETAEQLIRSAAVLTLLVLFLPQSPERTVGIIVVGMILCELFSSVTLLILYRRHIGPRLSGPGEESKALTRRIWSIALPIGCTSLLGNLMASANSVLIPQRLVAGGMEVSAAMSAFGVLFGMSLPLLYLPSAFIGAMGLILVPKLAESAALGRRREICRRIQKSLLATSVLTMPAMAFLVVLGPTIGLFLFREPTVGDHLIPLSVGVLLSCYQSILSCALNGVGRQGASARNALISGAIQLAFTFFAVERVGLLGYVAGFLVSSGVGVLLNWWGVARATGLKPQLFQWLISPALAALLTGLCINLLFQVLLDRGFAAVPSAAGCLIFGAVLYLSALQAQGVRPLQLFRLPRS
jgi:stage V sporulation protein B